MKKICICGHYGFGKNLMNGQTIKTKIITNELEKQFGNNNVLKIDTHGSKIHIIKSILCLVNAMFICKNLIIMPAHNGVRVLSPILSFMRHFSFCKLHYIVIGGWLPEFLNERKRLQKQLKQFDGIYVETNSMKKALNKMGLENIILMPNCKKITLLRDNELVYPNGDPYKLCTFSRIMLEKGIEDAIEAVKLINQKLARTVYTLDIYGQIDNSYAERFEKIQKEFPDYIRYCGYVPFNKSVETLKDYFLLLFPTYYEGEGFGGTLIDAFSAGVPIIATDWHYNTEIITEQVGFVYPTNQKEKLTQILNEAYNNTGLILSKKVICLKEAEKYLPEIVISNFCQYLK